LSPARSTRRLPCHPFVWKSMYNIRWSLGAIGFLLCGRSTAQFIATNEVDREGADGSFPFLDEAEGDGLHSWLHTKTVYIVRIGRKRPQCSESCNKTSRPHISPAIGSTGWDWPTSVAEAHSLWPAKKRDKLPLQFAESPGMAQLATCYPI
jgi:hypothetical protein